MSKKKTYEEIKNVIELQFLEWMSLKLVSTEYINNKQKLVVEDDYGYLYNLSFDKLSQAYKRKSILEKFNPNNNFTLNNISNYLVLNNVDFKLLSKEYIGNNSNLIFKCSHDHIFNRTLSALQTHKMVCIECDGKVYRNSNTYKDEVSRITNNEYSVIGDFINVDYPTLIKHNICGCEWRCAPYSFLSGTRCRKCSGRIDSKEEMNEILFNELNGEYIIIGDFINKTKNTLVRHIPCGNEWNVTIRNLMGYSFCPNCVASKAEKTIVKILTELKLYFKEQYRIKDCKNKKPLPFDFAIFEDKEKTKLKFLIEYDGRQHFLPSQFGGSSYKEAVTQLDKTIINDNIKNKYCKNNNIKLIRIPYWQYDKLNEILLNKVINKM